MAVVNRIAIRQNLKNSFRAICQSINHGVPTVGKNVMCDIRDTHTDIGRVAGYTVNKPAETDVPLSDWESAHVDALGRALNMRYVQLVRSLSNDPAFVSIARRDAMGQQLLDEARAWLPAASAYEEMNGALSLVDRENKDWLMLTEVRAALRRQLARHGA